MSYVRIALVRVSTSLCAVFLAGTAIAEPILQVSGCSERGPVMLLSSFPDEGRVELERWDHEAKS